MNTAAIIERIAGLRLAVVGDCMVDRFVWGSVDRISPEAPVPVVRIREETFKLGGAANVAAGIRALGAEVVLCGLCGRDEAASNLQRLLREREIGNGGLVSDGERPTTIKTRIIAHNQQVCRTDREDDRPVDEAIVEQMLANLAGVEGLSGIVVSDYGKGLLTGAALKEVFAHARRAGVPVVVDPKRGDYTKYLGATSLTPNQREAEQAWGRPIADEADLRDAGRTLLGATGSAALLITRGENGMALFEKDGREHHLATRATTVYDVTGAGDTVIAVYTAALAAGADFAAAAGLANDAAGLAVRELGTAAITAAQLSEATSGAAS